jgi:uncharacterized phosphosugar-binding protein
MPEHTAALLAEIRDRLDAIAADAEDGGLDAAIDIMTASIADGGVVQAFGTGHSQAFAMEIAGRAGGLIPTNAINLRDLALYGSRDPDELAGSALERDPTVVEELFALYPIHPADVFVIASNSGVNGSVVGMALLAKQHGHPVIAVTSIEHTRAVTPKHPSGQRLSDIADVVLDNRAPYGDTTIDVPVAGPDSGAAGSGPRSVRVGAVSSVTAAFIAQLLTLGVTERIAATGATPPVYISANIPEGDEHNNALEARYGHRIKRGLPPASISGGLPPADITGGPAVRR